MESKIHIMFYNVTRAPKGGANGQLISFITVVAGKMSKS